MHINIKLGFPSHSFVFWLVSTITITFPVSFDHPWLGNVSDQLCPEIMYDALHLCHLPVEQVIFLFKSFQLFISHFLLGFPSLAILCTRLVVFPSHFSIGICSRRWGC